MTPNEAFMNVSGLLTGVDDLDSALGESYRRQIEECYCAELNDLIDAYRKAVLTKDPEADLQRQLKEDTAGRLWLAARQVIKAWYLSQFDDPGDKATLTRKAGAAGFAPSALPPLPGELQRGLIWRIVQAHPPAYSVQPHGYWSQKP